MTTEHPNETLAQAATRIGKTYMIPSFQILGGFLAGTEKRYTREEIMTVVTHILNNPGQYLADKAEEERPISREDSDSSPRFNYDAALQDLLKFKSMLPASAQETTVQPPVAPAETDTPPATGTTLSRTEILANIARSKELKAREDERRAHRDGHRRA